MTKRPYVIGLSGGIGSGKSTVAAAFRRLGCVVSDSDAEARRVMERPDVIATLVAWWGESVIDSSGVADRKAIANIVFSDAGERKRLEGLIHPLILKTRETLIATAQREGAPAVIVDAPLLFEAGLDAECDALIFVETPISVRRERVKLSRGWREGELERREASQLAVEEKRARSHFVIVNHDMGPEELQRQAKTILTQIDDKPEFTA